ncbi:MAG: Mut7-C RNAse domain-containing protein [Proteobacteria bacterium]|nr:Mut7-C RNAse domain-containing protein [Pseudomonadota bacterium]
MNRSNDICFTAAAMLGKLAKWLRILGFDTVYDAHAANGRFNGQDDAKRILLTRAKRVRDRKTNRDVLFITSNDPFEQVKEVLQSLGVDPDHIRPFSRCIRCNIAIRAIDKDAVRGRVPDYVWETHVSFQICRRCRRIYWPGSHAKRSFDIIERFFDK